MTPFTESARLFALWQQSRQLLSSVKTYQVRAALLRQEERGLTKPVGPVAVPLPGSYANDSHLLKLEEALKQAVPHLKAELDNALFEEWLIGEGDTDTSGVPF